MGDGTVDSPKWQISAWVEAQDNLLRSVKRTFDWREFQGYTNSDDGDDEMVQPYDASHDEHTMEAVTDNTTLNEKALRHNMMRSWLEVSEWLGDGATKYGSHNGYVSRKMSLAWLFNAIKALINWKMENQDKWGEVDVCPLVVDGTGDLSGVRERFLDGKEGGEGVRRRQEHTR